MFQECNSTTGKDDWHFNHPIDSYSGLIAGCNFFANKQEMNKKQEKKLEFNVEKENFSPSKRQQNGVRFSKNVSKEEFESREGKIRKHELSDNVGLSESSQEEAVAECRRPFALINLISFCPTAANKQGMNRKQENLELNVDKENFLPSKRRQNVSPFAKNVCKEEFESGERKIGKPILIDNVVLSESTLEDSISNEHTINPELLISNYFHMREMEAETQPFYRNSECKIGKALRSSMINYLLYTSEKYELESETFHLAAYYFDRFLPEEVVEVSGLLLVAIGSILIAWKYDDSRDKEPKMNDLVLHLSGSFRKREIVKMEQRILRALDFQASYPTAQHFLQIFCTLCKATKEANFLSQCICDLSLFYEDICFRIEPSRIAAASLFLSMCMLGSQNAWGDLSVLSRYEVRDLKSVVHLLFF